MRTPSSTRRNDAGLALVLVLVFVTLLSVIVVEFAYEMQVDATLIARNSSNTEAYLAARSSIALSMSVLAADLLIGEEETRDNSTGFYDGLDEPWAASTPLVEFGDAMASIEITDEYGKLNLNALIYESSGGREVEFEPLVTALTILLQSHSVDVLPVDALLDWLDADDEPRPNGFENDYYQNLETPYECKNGPMDSIEELLLIPGITQEMYFGEFDSGDEAAPLPDLLTVHGHPEGKVNVNTAQRELLEAMFAADPNQVDPVGMVDRVVQRLDEVGPFLSQSDLRAEGLIPTPEPPEENQDGSNTQNTPPPAPAPDLFDVRSSVFRIRGSSRTGDAEVRVEAYVWRDTPQEGQGSDLTASGAAQMFRIIDWRILQ